MPQLNAICRYPVKGLGSDRLDQVELSAGQTLPFDRAWAIENGEGAFDPAHPGHVKKKNFLMLAGQAALARAACRFDAAGHALTVSFAGEPDITLTLDDASTHARLFERLQTLLGDVRGRLRIVHAPGQAMTDIAQPFISLINLASVRDLAQRCSIELDPLRFRGNLLIDGLEPWAEFDWVGQDIMIGSSRLTGQSRIRRCAATSVNPATAERDLDIPAALMAHYGHADCGIYLAITQGGRVATGDAVQISRQA
tara:strand:+ start:557 stop:1318 length:762 start_codon:yes stop_codon:yes gene_type:complete